MSEDYKVQISAKIGDHMVNVRGETTGEALLYLAELRAAANEIHGAMETLDGRPATEIVQKEKTWGARSQSGRTYPRAGASPTGSTATTSPGAIEILKDELGAVVISTSTNPPSPSSTPHVPDSNPELCAAHGLKRKFHEAGKNATTGKDFSASWRCPAAGCKPLWQKSDGSFQ